MGDFFQIFVTFSEKLDFTNCRIFKLGVQNEQDNLSESQHYQGNFFYMENVEVSLQKLGNFLHHQYFQKIIQLNLKTKGNNLDARFHKPSFKFQTLRSPIKSPLSARVGHFFKIKTFLKASSLSILCLKPKLYIPSTQNNDFIFWHTHFIVTAVK